MPNIFILTWYFYRKIYIINLILTLACILNVYETGTWFIGFTFFIKMAGYAATIFYKNNFDNKTFMYFRNAGYGIIRMYCYTFGFDLIAYAVILTLFSLTIPGFAHVNGR